MGLLFEQLYMERRRELYCPVWLSFTGTKPGLFSNENKKAFELYWYPQLETNGRNDNKESQTISENWDEGEYLLHLTGGKFKAVEKLRLRAYIS